MLLDSKTSTLEEVRELATWCEQQFLAKYGKRTAGTIVMSSLEWEHPGVHELLKVGILEGVKIGQVVLGENGKRIIRGDLTLDEALGIPDIVVRALKYFNELYPTLEGQGRSFPLRNDHDNAKSRSVLVRAGLIILDNESHFSYGPQGERVSFGQASALSVLRKWYLSLRDQGDGALLINATNSTVTVGNHNTVTVGDIDRTLHGVVEHVGALGASAPQLFEMLCRIRRLEEDGELRKETLDELEIEAFVKKVKPSYEEPVNAVLKLAPSVVRAYFASKGLS